MSPTHPLSANVKTPTLAFTATQPVGGPDVTLKGTLKNGTTALAGVTVYLQSTPDGTIFTDVTSVTTDRHRRLHVHGRWRDPRPAVSRRRPRRGRSAGRFAVGEAGLRHGPRGQGDDHAQAHRLTAVKIKVNKIVTAKGDHARAQWARR